MIDNYPFLDTASRFGELTGHWKNDRNEICFGIKRADYPGDPKRGFMSIVRSELGAYTCGNYDLTRTEVMNYLMAFADEAGAISRQVVGGIHSNCTREGAIQ